MEQPAGQTKFVLFRVGNLQNRVKIAAESIFQDSLQVIRVLQDPFCGQAGHPSCKVFRTVAQTCDSFSHPAQNRNRTMLENNPFQPALRIAANFTAIDKYIVGLLAGKTERSPFTQLFAGVVSIHRIAGIKAEIPVESQ